MMQKAKPHISILYDTIWASSKIRWGPKLAISRHKVSLHYSPYIYSQMGMKLDTTPVRPKNKIKIFTGK